MRTLAALLIAALTLSSCATGSMIDYRGKKTRSVNKSKVIERSAHLNKKRR